MWIGNGYIVVSSTFKYQPYSCYHYEDFLRDTLQLELYLSVLPVSQRDIDVLNSVIVLYLTRVDGGFKMSKYNKQYN